jgi:hypothetical protein
MEIEKSVVAARKRTPNPGPPVSIPTVVTIFRSAAPYNTFPFTDLSLVSRDFFFLLVSWGGVRVQLLLWPVFGLLYQSRMVDECGAVGGMRIDRGNRSTRRKPATVPLCPPQIPYDLTWARTRAAAVGSRRLTAWAMARSETVTSDTVTPCINCWGYIALDVTRQYEGRRAHRRGLPTLNEFSFSDNILSE